MLITTLLAAALAGLLLLGRDARATDLRDIKLRRLFEPTPAELRAERSGRIYIYEGLLESDVARAMAEQFDRVDSMMFIRVQRPVQTTERKSKEPVEYQTQNDGC